MAAVQMMCARIGKVTGQGLAGNFKQRFPRWLLGVFIVALLVANTMPHTRDEWSTLVAILGTTISPYLFFWQASEEVEEEKAAGQSTLAQRRGATLKELKLRNIDVGVGAFFSNMVMFFIILTTAITLNRHGITHIETTRQAAEALRLLAGNFAATLFTVGNRGYCRCRISCNTHAGWISGIRLRGNTRVASRPE